MDRRELMKDIDPKELEEEIKRWVASEEGKKAIQESLRQAEKLSKQLKEARRVDPLRMLEPVTI